MIHELKKSIDNNVVLFGVKEALRHSKNLDVAYVPADCRQETLSLLGNNNVEIEVMDISKKELAEKLELNFRCEVFGLKK